jgi:DNA ligase (NAD+)
MISSNKPVNPPRRTFEGICAEYGLTLGDLSSLREAVDEVLPGILKAAGISQGLTWEHILTLEGLGDKSIRSLVVNIEASKERPLYRALFALGILHVGPEVAELLTQRYAGLEELAQAGQEELTQIPGIGPKIAESVVTYFEVPHNREVIEKLRRAGVKLHHQIRQVSTGDLPFQGKTFVVTGTLSGFNRREAEARIKAMGGSVISSVTRKTDYLVAGESPGSKLEAARRLGTLVLDEAAFLDLLDQAALESVS